MAKRYPSLKQDLIDLARELQDNPEIGVDLGRRLRKVRLAIASKGRGKSGGARVITLKTDAIVRIDEGIVTLITMYDKAEINSISSRELDRILKNSDLK